MDFVLDRVAQRDPEAMRQCIDQFGGLIWSIANRVVRTRADVEEVVQEIFTDLWRSAHRFDPEQGSEEVFVTMIARRRLIDRMRRAAQRDRAQSSDDIYSPGWADAGHADVCPEAVAAGRAVTQLRPELQQVLKLGLLRGMSHAQIATALKMPVDTVKTMMRSGLIQSREFMGSRSR